MARGIGAARRSEAVESVRGRIEQWRDAGRPGKRMPEELWDAAVELACEHGAFRIARDFGLSYAALKKRTAAAATVTRASGAPRGGCARFVEIDVGEVLGRGVGEATEIEVERSDGARLRIRLGGSQRLDVAAVATAFAGSRRR